MAKPPVAVLPPGTIVTRQARGKKHIHDQGRVLESFTTSDKLNRRQLWYRVEIQPGLVRDWPGSHCQVLCPAPASA
jgi:hypothetical protein